MVASGLVPEPAANTPAVVVGANADALGIARSLGVAGLPVILVDDHIVRPGMHSRFGSRFVVKSLFGATLIDGLLGLREKLQHRPVLYPTTDFQVRAISEQRERLSQAFYVRLPDHACVVELLHKQSFQKLAERLGFPVPHAVTIHNEAELAYLDEIQFPAVVKPGTKDFVIDKRAPRACRVNSREEAEALCRTVLPRAPDLIVQEWIEGKDDDIYFCLQYRGQDGETVSSFTGRKLRCWPPETGSTATCTAAPEAEAVLHAATKAFFDQTNYVGMGSMEFKWDRRNQKFVMIEPTIGRIDWQEEVATLNGVNIPLAAYCHEVGLPIPRNQRPPHPVVWSYAPSYWRSVIASRSFRDSRPQGARTTDACWRRNDPFPLVWSWLEWIHHTFTSDRWRELIVAAVPSRARR